MLPSESISFTPDCKSWKLAPSQTSQELSADAPFIASLAVRRPFGIRCTQTPCLHPAYGFLFAVLKLQSSCHQFPPHLCRYVGAIHCRQLSDNLNSLRLALHPKSPQLRHRLQVADVQKPTSFIEPRATSRAAESFEAAEGRCLQLQLSAWDISL